MIVFSLKAIGYGYNILGCKLKAVGFLLQSNSIQPIV